MTGDFPERAFDALTFQGKFAFFWFFFFFSLEIEQQLLEIF